METMYQDIVDFAELEPFMDQKLKNYSSGMQVRLAFSIAVKAKNDILIFDEVLAVGDEAFQRKCLDVFEQYKAEKQTVILVTHDMETVKRFCNRAMLINEGKIVEIGNPQKVANHYSDLNQQSIDKFVGEQNLRRQDAKYLKAETQDEDGKSVESYSVGDKAAIDVTWHGLSADSIESIGISIFKQSGEHITGINSRASEHSAGWKQKGHIKLVFDLDIAPGKYYVLVEAFKREGELIDALIDGPKFSVRNKTMTWSGLVELSHKWRED